jgi:phosphohistidine phosphatase SixA
MIRRVLARLARFPVLALVALAALALAPACADETGEPAGRAAPEADRALAAQLREGGLVLVFRHAVTETATDEQESLRSCALQRNLSAEGRAQARAIGRDLRALGLRVGDVLTSPLCRARDTARLMFGRAEIERDLVSPGVTGTIEDDDRRARALRRLAQTPPRSGTSIALVTHTGNIGAALGEATVAEGELLVYGEGAELVGRVPPELWQELRRRS